MITVVVVAVAAMCMLVAGVYRTKSFTERSFFASTATTTTADTSTVKVSRTAAIGSNHNGNIDNTVTDIIQPGMEPKDPNCTFDERWCLPNLQNEEEGEEGELLQYQHCYRHGNDWSRCAGDHLPYRPASSQEELKSRTYMCLYEPFCWKQLDWENEDPPIPTPTPTSLTSSNSGSNIYCPATTTSGGYGQFRFMDWSLHDGVLASTSTALRERFGMKTVINCNAKNSASSKRNYHYEKFDNCPTRPTMIQRSWKYWKSPSTKDDATKSFYEFSKNDTLGQSTDVHIVGFAPNLFEMLMVMNKTILLNMNHRVDMFRCSPEASRDTFRNLQRLASSSPSPTSTTGSGLTSRSGPSHIVAPQYLHDTEYIRHYTGIRPIFLPFSLLSILPKQPFKGTAEAGGKHCDTFIWNGDSNYIDKDVPTVIEESGLKFWTPSRYELTDLLEYRGVVVIPYSITNTKSLEQYEMNIPMFAPTPEFASKLGTLFGDRAATGPPYCPNLRDVDHAPPHISSPYDFSPNARARFDGANHSADEMFWFQFSEIYHWPCITYFDSWADLVDKLKDTATDDYLISRSKCMKQANKWRQYEFDTNMCWVLQQLNDPKYYVRNRTLDPEMDYKQTLFSLYGTDSLFTSEDKQ